MYHFYFTDFGLHLNITPSTLRPPPGYEAEQKFAFLAVLLGLRVASFLGPQGPLAIFRSREKGVDRGGYDPPE